MENTVWGEETFSMPALSGLYGSPPFEYRKTKQLICAFETDPSILKGLLPPELGPNEDAILSLSVGEYLCTGFGLYLEAHLFTTAHFQGRLVNFSIYQILNSDVAVCAGREIWGFPKKLGRLTFQTRDDVVSGTVERGGIKVIEAAVRLEELGSHSDADGPHEWICRRHIPSILENAPPDVDQLTSTTLSNVITHDVYIGDSTLSFKPSPADPFYKIPIKNMKTGLFVENQFTLPSGSIAHDYRS